MWPLWGGEYHHVSVRADVFVDAEKDAGLLRRADEIFRGPAADTVPGVKGTMDHTCVLVAIVTGKGS